MQMQHDKARAFALSARLDSRSACHLTDAPTHSSCCLMFQLALCVCVSCTHSYERSTREDGRRCHKWFLVDEYSTEHLAVVGVETDTMDGHYNYNAVSELACVALCVMRAPFSCGCS